jgi:hypothetical protein
MEQKSWATWGSSTKGLFELVTGSWDMHGHAGVGCAGVHTEAGGTV